MGLIKSVRTTIANKVDAISKDMAQARAEKKELKSIENKELAAARREQAKVYAQKRARIETDRRLQSFKTGSSGFGGGSSSGLRGAVFGSGSHQPFNPITGGFGGGVERKQESAARREKTMFVKVGKKYVRVASRTKKKITPISSPKRFDVLGGGWG